MALDFRQGKRKRVFFPLGDGKNDTETYVDIPVITSTPFLANRGQQYNYRVTNDSTNHSRIGNSRRVRHATKSGSDVTYDDEIYIDVERPTLTRTAGHNAQGFKNRLNNNDPAPRTPESAAGLGDEEELGHFKVHYVRFYQDNDDTKDTWMTVEMIDQMNVIGSRGQLYKYKFKHPTAEEYAELGQAPSGKTWGSQIDDDDPYRPILGYCPQSLELMPTEEEGIGIDAPWRLSPDRNIVNVNRSGYYVLVWWLWADFNTSNLGERCLIAGCTAESPAVRVEGIASTTSPTGEGVDITFETEDDDDPSTDFPLINDPVTVVYPGSLGGYSTFGPPAPEDLGCTRSGLYPCTDIHAASLCIGSEDGSSDPVPWNNYYKAFLLDLVPSPEESTDPKTVGFSIFGLPNPNPFYILARTLPLCTTGSSEENNQYADCISHEYIRQGTSGTQFQIHVYRKQDVDYYPQDPGYPLRKKGMNPADDTYAGNNWAITKSVSISNSFMFGATYLDPDLNIHDALSNVEAGTEGTGASTGSSTENIEFTFQNFKLPTAAPNVTRPVMWPSSPEKRIMINGFNNVKACGNGEPATPLEPSPGEPHEVSVLYYIFNWRGPNGELFQIQTAPYDSMHSWETAPNEPKEEGQIGA